MTALRTLALGALLLAGCSDGSGPSPETARTEAERDLARATRDLEQSRAANAALLDERNASRSRIETLTAAGSRLEQRNRELAARLARSDEAGRSLRRQRDEGLRRMAALDAEVRSLRANLARANGEIRRLRVQRPDDQRRLADAHLRGVAAGREFDRLRRHNAFLLRERGNLQAWLQEANAARRSQQDAMATLEQNVAREKAARTEADAANAGLRARLDGVEGLVSTLEANRDGLEQAIAREKSARTEADATIAGLRADLERAEGRVAALTSDRDSLQSRLADLKTRSAREAEARQKRATELEAALARADTKTDGAPGTGDAPSTKVDLETDLEAANERIARLESAKRYLVEKLEACTDAKQAQRAELDALEWMARVASQRMRSSGFLRVATETTGQEKAPRHEKELRESRERLKTLEAEQAALQKRLAETRTELEAARKQVETLTWANKKLVKELDAAYAGNKGGPWGALPEGYRGSYVVQKGQSLSEIAKAFYGDPGRWTDLVAANRDKIPDPNMVKAGTVILIPD